MPTLSIILPAFNEEDNISGMVEAGSQIAPQVASEWEIIIVNDGSSDRTGRICDDLAAKLQNVRVVHHPVNCGYGAALKSGITLARYDLIFFTDSDGQYDLGEVPRFLEYAEKYDIVAGYRGRRSDPIHRLINAKGWNILVRLALGIRIRDIDCAFKVFRRHLFERVQIRSVGAMVNTEILAQAAKFGFTMKEIEVKHLPRCHGQPTGANLAVILKAFRELFKLWGKLRCIAHDQEGLFPKREAMAPSKEKRLLDVLNPHVIIPQQPD